jgi:hypothetical protein
MNTNGNMKDKDYESLYLNNRGKLESIPFESRTPELCLVAMSWKTNEFRHVPDSLKTPEICLAAVQRYGFLLEYVPVPLRTLAVCIAAIQEEKDGKLLSFVPEEIKSYDFYMKVFTSSEYDKKADDILDGGQFPDLGCLFTVIRT